MPLIIIKSNASNVSSEIKSCIFEETGNSLSRILQKSKDFVMTLLELEQEMCFAGNADDICAYVEIKNVGTITPDVSKELSGEITAILCKYLDVCKERVYLEFQQSDRHLWGWNGKTFS